MRAKLLKVFRILPWLLLTVICSLLYFGHGLKDLDSGRGQRIAFDVFGDTEGVDEVRIYRLEGTPEQKTNDVFRVWGFNTGDLDVFGSVSVTFEDYDAFMHCWRGQIPTIGSGGMCHEAPYGFRLYRDGKLVTETSICWHCENYTVKELGPFRTRLHGFDPRSDAAKALLAFCDARLPYYRPPTKLAKP
jgi:hypothetical protein